MHGAVVRFERPDDHGRVRGPRLAVEEERGLVVRRVRQQAQRRHAAHGSVQVVGGGATRRRRPHQLQGVHGARLLARADRLKQRLSSDAGALCPLVLSGAPLAAALPVDDARHQQRIPLHVEVERAAEARASIGRSRVKGCQRTLDDLRHALLGLGIVKEARADAGQAHPHGHRGAAFEGKGDRQVVRGHRGRVQDVAGLDQACETGGHEPRVEPGPGAVGGAKMRGISGVRVAEAPGVGHPRRAGWAAVSVRRGATQERAQAPRRGVVGALLTNLAISAGVVGGAQNAVPVATQDETPVALGREASRQGVLEEALALGLVDRRVDAHQGDRLASQLGVDAEHSPLRPIHRQRHLAALGEDGVGLYEDHAAAAPAVARSEEGGSPPQRVGGRVGDMHLLDHDNSKPSFRHEIHQGRGLLRGSKAPDVEGAGTQGACSPGAVHPNLGCPVLAGCCASGGRHQGGPLGRGAVVAGRGGPAGRGRGEGVRGGVGWPCGSPAAGCGRARSRQPGA